MTERGVLGGWCGGGAGRMLVTATASCTGFRAVVEATGEAVTEGELARRVGWLSALIQGLSTGVVAAHWNPADLDVLASGVSGDGRPLPAKGWMAVRRLGWSCASSGAVYVSDRVARAAEEEAARSLRLSLHRRAIITAVVATWPEDPGHRTEEEWAALRAVLPAGVGAAQVRNRTRQVRAHLARHGTLPDDLTGLEEPPVCAGQVLLAAADKQFTTVDRVDAASIVLRVQLPLADAPTSRREWAWHVLEVTLPPTVPAEAKVCSPTLRVVKGRRVRVDLPFRTLAPDYGRDGHTVAIGFDWGCNTLLTGTVARLVDGRVWADGRMLRYDATVLSAKLHRLRRHREHLAAKRAHYAMLLTGTGLSDSRWRHLHDLYARADAEHEAVCARIRRLNHALAWSAARWAVDHAVVAGASVIYLEDLATLETRGRGRGVANARLSGQVRATIANALRHLAVKEGIAVVTIPARGTSKYCPRCGIGTAVLKHVPAPDRTGESGWKWSVCPHCGLSCDRDWAAAERITSRGLLSQHLVRAAPKTRLLTVTVAVEGNVARARRPKTSRNLPVRRPGRAAPSGAKTGPTPKQPMHKTSRRVPDRRTVPSPSPIPGSGQRPEGRRPQTHRKAGTGAAHDHLNVGTGFHHVRATPIPPPLAGPGPRAGPRHAQNA